MALIYENGFIIEKPDSEVVRPQGSGDDLKSVIIVSSRQAKLALLNTPSPVAEAETFLDLVEWYISCCDRETQIWFHEAGNWESDNPRVIEISEKFGLSDDERYQLFVKAEKIIV